MACIALLVSDRDATATTALLTRRFMQSTPKSLLRAVLLVFALTIPACAMTADDEVTTTMTSREIAVAPHARVCGIPQRGEAECHAHVLVDADGQPVPNANPAGLGPSQLRSAY